MPPNKLGIPLLQETFPVEHKVGCRYWRIDDEGNLGAPISGAGSNIWVPGLNMSRCNSQGHKYSPSCSCGLYGFRWDKNLDQTSYFSLKHGTINGVAGGGGTHVIGGVAYWTDAQGNLASNVFRAKYAAVACLLLPQGVDEAGMERVKKATELYQVQLVKASDLGTAVDEWVDMILPTFYAPPPKPLFELLGKATAVASNEVAWERKSKLVKISEGEEGWSKSTRKRESFNI